MLLFTCPIDILLFDRFQDISKVSVESLIALFHTVYRVSIAFAGDEALCSALLSRIKCLPHVLGLEAVEVCLHEVLIAGLLAFQVDTLFIIVLCDLLRRRLAFELAVEK